MSCKPNGRKTLHTIDKGSKTFKLQYSSGRSSNRSSSLGMIVAVFEQEEEIHRSRGCDSPMFARA